MICMHAACIFLVLLIRDVRRMGRTDGARELTIRFDFALILRHVFSEQPYWVYVFSNYDVHISGIDLFSNSFKPRHG